MSDQTSYFAPAERLSPQEVYSQALHFQSLSMHEIFKAVPILFLVVNRCRQIVCANERFLDMVGAPSVESIMGMRPGEVLGCREANAAPAGCGTAEFCSTCGAARAILDGLDGNEAVKECEVTREDGTTLELRIWTTPTQRGGEPYTIFSAASISDERRRKNLERTFFHDISNTVIGLWSMAEELVEDKGKHTPKHESILMASRWLVEEVRVQRKLLDAEEGALEVTKEEVSSLEILEQCMRLYRNRKPFEGISLVLGDESTDVTLETDVVLLRRVLINMMKNALEATPDGGTVRGWCQADRGMVRFFVNNPGCMGKDVQMRLFQKSFSTKGGDRGVGTYAMKLFAETYLGGFIYFKSTPEEGTTFTLSIPDKISDKSY